MGKHALAGGFRRRDEPGALKRRVRRIGRDLGGPISPGHLVLSLACACKRDERLVSFCGNGARRTRAGAPPRARREVRLRCDGFGAHAWGVNGRVPFRASCCGAASVSARFRSRRAHEFHALKPRRTQLRETGPPGDRGAGLARRGGFRAPRGSACGVTTSDVGRASRSRGEIWGRARPRALRPPRGARLRNSPANALAATRGLLATRRDAYVASWTFSEDTA
jgi:hypothetical protein